jgi:hypothetical protein
MSGLSETNDAGDRLNDASNAAQDLSAETPAAHAALVEIAWSATAEVVGVAAAIHAIEFIAHQFAIAGIDHCQSPWGLSH